MQNRQKAMEKPEPSDHWILDALRRIAMSCLFAVRLTAIEIPWRKSVLSDKSEREATVESDE
jgi:hypothetical protein